MEEHMFVAIARFPQVPSEREAEFRAWFAWSNDLLRDIDGLQGRRLLRASDGSYTALVEHTSAETFAAMSATEVASRVGALLQELLLDQPAATMYEVVADLANSGSCCGGASGHGGQRRHDLALVTVPAEAQVAGGCCRGA
jgi:heme-degrading monooxygenase HmoA